MLALVVVQHYRSSGPRYTTTHGARVVHYGTTIAVVPYRHGRQLIVLLHGRGSGPGQFLSNQLFAALAKPNAQIGRAHV